MTKVSQDAVLQAAATIFAAEIQAAAVRASSLSPSERSLVPLSSNAPRIERVLRDLLQAIAAVEQRGDDEVGKLWKELGPGGDSMGNGKR